MKVAVPGMEHVPDNQPVMFADALDLRQRVRDLGPGNHSILRVIRRGDTPHGAECGLAAQPQKLALLFIFRMAHFARFLLQANGAHGFGLLFHHFTHPLKLNQQHRRRIFRVPGVDVGFNATHHPAIQHFQRRRRHTALRDRHHRIGSVFHGVVNPQQRCHVFGQFGELDGDSRHYPHGAFRADKEARQVQSG